MVIGFENYNRIKLALTSSDLFYARGVMRKIICRDFSFSLRAILRIGEIIFVVAQFCLQTLEVRDKCIFIRFVKQKE